MTFSLSAEELAAICGTGRLEGTTTERIRAIASLAQARPGDLTFLGNPKYRSAVATSQGSVVIVPEDHPGTPGANQAFLRVTNPSLALARVCKRLEQQLWPRPPAGIHPSAVVDPSAHIAPGVTIGPLCVVEAGAVIGERSWLEAGVYVGRNVRVGADSRLYPGVKVLAECVVGERVILQAGVVVGSDGFGYETVRGRHEKVPQVGNVHVCDDVEIGANATIDRARFNTTVIGEGAKLDNLVQIGHNVTVGKHCIICAQVGISGSTTLEDYVVLGGQAGLAGHLTVGRGSKVDGQTGVNSDLAPGSFVKGSPCLPYNLEQRLNVLRKRIPDLFKRVDALEAALHLDRAAPAADAPP
ncbi:MAG: UDP-3-O-(3-hydroxymyristoyl)glucosamine N-acyltransferase [Opitutaceae bacterium]|nr:UDP-3-O-(3-hydroxymyristoyl)glucosamine N-acyltransferase [Opitutaceae bacterium]